VDLEQTILRLSSSTTFSVADLEHAIHTLEAYRAAGERVPRSDAEIAGMLDRATELAAESGNPVSITLIMVDDMLSGQEVVID
jgi:hypothetical protein